MTRAARSYAFGTTASFFEKAFFASLFRQDPRYHRSGKTGAGAKIGYAVTRVFVTQGDRCGCQQFNASFLLGGAAAAGAATTSTDACHVDGPESADVEPAPRYASRAGFFLP